MDQVLMAGCNEDALEPDFVEKLCLAAGAGSGANCVCVISI